MSFIKVRFSKNCKNLRYNTVEGDKGKNIIIYSVLWNKYILKRTLFISCNIQLLMISVRLSNKYKSLREFDCTNIIQDYVILVLIFCYFNCTPYKTVGLGK